MSWIVFGTLSAILAAELFFIYKKEEKNKEVEDKEEE